MKTKGIAMAANVLSKKEIDEYIRLHYKPNDEADDIYRLFNMPDKIDLLKYRPEKTVHFTVCNGYHNYMYG